MNRAIWRIKLGFGLAAATAFVLLANLMVFGMPKETTFWVMHSLAMMPIEILVVTLILNQLLEGRARQEMIHKLNMVIGAFFSEVGSDLLRRITAFDADVEVRENFFVKDDWDNSSFAKAKAVAAAYDYTVDAARGDLAGLGISSSPSATSCCGARKSKPPRTRVVYRRAVGRLPRR